MKHAWRNVAGKFVVEVYYSNGIVYDIDGYELPELDGALDRVEDDFELVIEFTSSGYNDPGSMYGGPDGVGYAPESDDERLLTSAYLVNFSTHIGLDDKTGQALFEKYRDEIYEVELDDQDEG